MKRVVRLLVIIALLGFIVFLVWLRSTREGRQMAGDLSDGWQQWRHGDEEKNAAEKLKTLGVQMVRSAPPERALVSLDCQDLTLGDEGYRLIGKCFRVEQAKFTHCDLNDDRLQYLAGLSHLGALTILDTPAVTGAGMKHITGLQDMVSLILEGTAVGDAGLKSIAQLSDLKVLDLRNTPVTDAGMPALAGMHALQRLLLNDTAVTDDGVAKLDGLRDLKELDLSGTKVTDVGKARLKKMYPDLKFD